MIIMETIAEIEIKKKFSFLSFYYFLQVRNNDAIVYLP